MPLSASSESLTQDDISAQLASIAIPTETDQLLDRCDRTLTSLLALLCSLGADVADDMVRSYAKATGGAPALCGEQTNDSTIVEGRYRAAQQAFNLKQAEEAKFEKSQKADAKKGKPAPRRPQAPSRNGRKPWDRDKKRKHSSGKSKKKKKKKKVRESSSSDSSSSSEPEEEDKKKKKKKNKYHGRGGYQGRGRGRGRGRGKS